jgi:hypothetical protein
MDTLIPLITERIKSQVAAILYADEDWGQLDYYSSNPPVKWPCSLADVYDVQWSNEGNKAQIGIGQVRIKVADLRLSNSSTKAPTAQKTKSASFYTLTQSVYKALHGWSAGEQYGPLMRLNERRLQRDDGIKEHHIIFTVQIKDASAMPVKTTLAAAIVKPELQELED